MSVTDEDRAFARKTARRIYHNHLARDRAGCDANHIAQNLDYEEALRRGLMAECAFSHEFGPAVGRELRDDGDGGIDFFLAFRVRRRVQRFPVNVKAKSVRFSLEGLIRSGTHLRVPVREAKPQTIYVFAVYYEKTDDADVLRWEWGRTLIERNERRIFLNGDGAEAYVAPYQELRDLQELKGRAEKQFELALLGGQQHEAAP